MKLGVIFKIAIHLKDWHVFMQQSQNTLKVFNTLTLKQIFKVKNHFQKAGVIFFS